VTAAAILFATVGTAQGPPAAALRCGDSTLLGRLLDQLAHLGFTRATVITRPGWEGDIKAATAHAGLDVDLRSSANTGEDALTIAEIASSVRQPLVIGSGDVLTHREALAGLLADPRVVSGILTTGRMAGSWAFRTRAERGRLVSAGSPYHRVRKPTGYFLGFIKVDPRDRESLVEAAQRMGELAEPPLPQRWDEEFELKRKRWRLRRVRARARQEAETGAEQGPEAGGVLVQEHLDKESVNLDTDGIALDAETERDLVQRADVARQDALPLILVGLIRSQVSLTNSYLRELFWARPLSQESADTAVEQMRSYDEDRVLLNSAVKGSDGFFTTFFVSPYSKYIARWAARRGWSPNGVTTLSMALGVVTAVLFATGTRWGLVSGAVMLQLAFTFDCVDGQLARYTRTFSKFGAWLDSIFDRAKEYVAYAGLAIGSVIGFATDVWALAAAALALQTLRHTVDFSFASARHHVLASLPALPFEQPEDKRVSTQQPQQPVEEVDKGEPEADKPLLARLGGGAVRLSRSLERRSWTRWVKKIIVLPIGERFALISVTAALWNPQVTFLALLIWGGFALAYQLTGRILRSMAA
jgi:phosphatidylglycerophosphate synthase